MKQKRFTLPINQICALVAVTLRTVSVLRIRISPVFFILSLRFLHELQFLFLTVNLLPQLSSSSEICISDARQSILIESSVSCLPILHRSIHISEPIYYCRYEAHQSSISFLGKPVSEIARFSVEIKMGFIPTEESRKNQIEDFKRMLVACAGLSRRKDGEEQLRFPSISPASRSYTPNRLNMRRSATANSVVRIGGVEEIG
ncbi:hypothetical protein LINPERHAP2_LOCUS15903 [Linum perenne]